MKFFSEYMRMYYSSVRIHEASAIKRATSSSLGVSLHHNQVDGIGSVLALTMIHFLYERRLGLIGMRSSALATLAESSYGDIKSGIQSPSSTYRTMNDNVSGGS